MSLFSFGIFPAASAAQPEADLKTLRDIRPPLHLRPLEEQAQFAARVRLEQEDKQVGQSVAESLFSYGDWARRMSVNVDRAYVNKVQTCHDYFNDQAARALASEGFTVPDGAVTPVVKVAHVTPTVKLFYIFNTHQLDIRTDRDIKNILDVLKGGVAKHWATNIEDSRFLPSLTNVSRADRIPAHLIVIFKTPPMDFKAQLDAEFQRLVVSEMPRGESLYQALRSTIKRQEALRRPGLKPTLESKDLIRGPNEPPKAIFERLKGRLKPGAAPEDGQDICF